MGNFSNSVFHYLYSSLPFTSLATTSSHNTTIISGFFPSLINTSFLSTPSLQFWTPTFLGNHQNESLLILPTLSFPRLLFFRTGLMTELTTTSPVHALQIPYLLSHHHPLRVNHSGHSVYHLPTLLLHHKGKCGHRKKSHDPACWFHFKFMTLSLNLAL